jgi:hypothetical protein
MISELEQIIIELSSELESAKYKGFLTIPFVKAESWLYFLKIIKHEVEKREKDLDEKET